MRGVRSARFGTGFARCTRAEAASGTADLQARAKTFEVALLLVREVDGEGFDFHILRRSSCCHHVAQRETDCDRAEIERFPKSGPTSLVAAEVHRGRTPAGIHGSWLHCNIQVVCQRTALINALKINRL